MTRWTKRSTVAVTGLLLAAPVWFATSPAASQPFAILRVQDDEEIRIPLRAIAGVWMLDVVLNDGARGRFLLDTGASFTVVSPRLIDDLGIEPGSHTVQLQTANGRIRVPLVRLESVRVGDAEAVDVVAAVHPIASGIDGLLGNSFLARFHVTVDTKRGVLTLRPR